MKRLLICFLISFTTAEVFAGNNDTLYVNYFENNPFTFRENSKLQGIEIEIINEYLLWLKSKKNLDMPVKYTAFTEFDNFYQSTKASHKNTIGLGTLTINELRKKELDFTDAYIKNVAFCITNGNAPDIKIKNKDEITRVLGNMTAVTIQNSSLNYYILDLKKSYIPDLKLVYQSNPQKILDEISKNILQFGYVDAVSFWIYLKRNPGRFLKMQKALNQSKEELGFILPKGSQHTQWFNEFFSGTNGFKFSKTYRAILEKYLGTYMTQNMAVQ